LSWRDSMSMVIFDQLKRVISENETAVCVMWRSTSADLLFRMWFFFATIPESTRYVPRTAQHQCFTGNKNVLFCWCAAQLLCRIFFFRYYTGRPFSFLLHEYNKDRMLAVYFVISRHLTSNNRTFPFDINQMNLAMCKQYIISCLTILWSQRPSGPYPNSTIQFFHSVTIA
jgi:hypothetical protein